MFKHFTHCVSPALARNLRLDTGRMDEEPRLVFKEPLYDQRERDITLFLFPSEGGNA